MASPQRMPHPARLQLGLADPGIKAPGTACRENEPLSRQQLQQAHYRQKEFMRVPALARRQATPLPAAPAYSPSGTHSSSVTSAFAADDSSAMAQPQDRYDAEEYSNHAEDDMAYASGPHPAAADPCSPMELGQALLEHAEASFSEDMYAELSHGGGDPEHCGQPIDGGLEKGAHLTHLGLEGQPAVDEGPGVPLMDLWDAHGSSGQQLHQESYLDGLSGEEDYEAGPCAEYSDSQVSWPVGTGEEDWPETPRSHVPAPGDGKKKKRTRTRKQVRPEGAMLRPRFTREQTTLLERSFQEDRNLSSHRKAQLASQLNVQGRQVSIWFQNRRARWRYKQAGEEAVTMHAKFTQANDRCSMLEHALERMRKDHEAVLKQNAELRTQVAQLLGNPKDSAPGSSTEKGSQVGSKRPRAQDQPHSLSTTPSRAEHVATNSTFSFGGVGLADADQGSPSKKSRGTSSGANYAEAGGGAADQDSPSKNWSGGSFCWEENGAGEELLMGAPPEARDGSGNSVHGSIAREFGSPCPSASSGEASPRHGIMAAPSADAGGCAEDCGARDGGEEAPAAVHPPTELALLGEEGPTADAGHAGPEHAAPAIHNALSHSSELQSPAQTPLGVLTTVQSPAQTPLGVLTTVQNSRRTRDLDLEAKHVDDNKVSSKHRAGGGPWLAAAAAGPGLAMELAEPRCQTGPSYDAPMAASRKALRLPRLVAPRSLKLGSFLSTRPRGERPPSLPSAAPASTSPAEPGHLDALHLAQATAKSDMTGQQAQGLEGLGPAHLLQMPPATPRPGLSRDTAEKASQAPAWLVGGQAQEQCVLHLAQQSGTVHPAEGGSGETAPALEVQESQGLEGILMQAAAGSTHQEGSCEGSSWAAAAMEPDPNPGLGQLKFNLEKDLSPSGTPWGTPKTPNFDLGRILQGAVPPLPEMFQALHEDLQAPGADGGEGEQGPAGNGGDKCDMTMLHLLLWS